MLLDSEIMAWSKLYVVGKVVTWLIGLKSNVGGWMRAQRHLYKKCFVFTFTWWVDWSSSGDDWSATLNSVAGVGLRRRICEQTTQMAAINKWITKLTNTILLIMLSTKPYQSHGSLCWQFMLVKGIAGPSRTSLVLPQIYLTGQQPTVTFSVQYWSRQSTRNSQVQ